MTSLNLEKNNHKLVTFHKGKWQEVIPGQSYRIVEGVKATVKDENEVTVNEIIYPTTEHENGLIKCNMQDSGGITSWQQYEPRVIGAVWQVDLPEVVLETLEEGVNNGT